MKKTFVLLAFLIIGFTVNAQGFLKVGATAGIAVSDAGDIADWALGVDAYYMIEKQDAVINFGPTIGFRNFFMSNSGVDDAKFLPIAGAARLKLFGIFTGGVDVGYALGISDNLDGGFYYRPILGIDIADTIEINASLETISDNANWGNFNLGILIEF